jgi:hypothetical protein
MKWSRPPRSLIYQNERHPLLECSYRSNSAIAYSANTSGYRGRVRLRGVSPLQGQVHYCDVTRTDFAQDSRQSHHRPGPGYLLGVRRTIMCGCLLGFDNSEGRNLQCQGDPMIHSKNNGAKSISSVSYETDLVKAEITVGHCFRPTSARPLAAAWDSHNDRRYTVIRQCFIMIRFAISTPALNLLRGCVV